MALNYWGQINIDFTNSIHALTQKLINLVTIKKELVSISPVKP